MEDIELKERVEQVVNSCPEVREDLVRVYALDLYQVKAAKYAKYPEAFRHVYPTLGLVGEAGEVAEKVKKVIRDENCILTKEKSDEIAKELGDVMWYVANLARELGYSLSTIADMNIRKLESRYLRNKINGNGDNR